MLSDHERRQLAIIEETLAAGDRRLTRAVRAFGRGGRAGRRRWVARAVTGFGILVLVAGLVAGADASLILQGLLITTVGACWSLWLPSRAGSTSSAKGSGRPSAPRGGPPPEGSRR